MSDLSEAVNTTETFDEAHSLDGQELVGIKSAASNQSNSFTSEDVVQQNRAVIDPLSKQLELLCDLIKDCLQVFSDVARRLVYCLKACQ